jgi:hypothetical protein
VSAPAADPNVPAVQFVQVAASIPLFVPAGQIPHSDDTAALA